MAPLLKDYLAVSSAAVLGGSQEELTAALNSDASQQVLELFSTDQKHPAIFVRREDDAKQPDTSRYSVTLETRDLAKSTSSIAFVKTSAAHGVLDGERPLSEQLSVCQVSPKLFDSMLFTIRSCFVPFSRELGQTSENNDERYSGMVRSVTQKLVDLELELLKSQDSVAIPNVVFEFNAKVRQALQEAEAAGKRPNYESLDDPAGGWSDAEYLNLIQKDTNSWKKSIRNIVQMSLDREVSAGTALQEVNFWLAMEHTLDHIEKQLQSAPAEFCFELLRRNRRFVAVIGFRQECGLEDARKRVGLFSEIYRDLPLQRLLSTTALHEMPAGIKEIFIALEKAIKRVGDRGEADDKVLLRLIDFVAILSEDLAAQIRTVLGSQKIMELSYDDFVGALRDHEHVFRMWNKETEKLMEIVQSFRRARTHEIGDREHKLLRRMRTRLVELAQIRKQHAELRSIVQSTFENDRFIQEQSLNDIDLSYTCLTDTDAVSISQSGSDAWQRAIAAYNNKIARVESEIETKIRELLHAARTDANEMFRVCAKFNALFVRPRIQVAIREYQDPLIETVKRGIEELQRQYRQKYTNSQAAVLTRVRDIPPVSGAIIWAQQIERQLNLYLDRIEQVLGPKWVHHIEGRRLKEETDKFKIRLQPSDIFKQWLNHVDKMETFNVDSSIFRVDVLANKQYKLVVNFDRALITLSKEVRNLTRLGQKVPYEIKIQASEARARYPAAVALQESVSVYSRACDRLAALGDFALLGAIYQQKVQQLIQSGAGYRWHFNEKRLSDYVKKFSDAANLFEDKVRELTDRHRELRHMLRELETCKPSNVRFAQILGTVQEMVSDFDKHSFSNVYQWTTRLTAQIEKILAVRLTDMLDMWMEGVDRADPTEEADAGSGDGSGAVGGSRRQSLVDAVKSRIGAAYRRRGSSNIGGAGGSASASLNGGMAPIGEDKVEELSAEDEKLEDSYIESLYIPEPTRHQVVLHNQILQLSPPIQVAKMSLIDHLQRWMACVLNLPRLHCYYTPESDPKDFVSVLKLVDQGVLAQCFKKMMEKIKAAESYSQEWLRYQAIFDMDMNVVLQAVGNKLDTWSRLLRDMKSARATFDSSSDEKAFGPVVVNYSSVQQKVNDRYESFHRDILARFAAKLNSEMGGLHSTLGDSRTKLEESSFLFGSTSEIVQSVTLLQDLSLKAEQWDKDLKTYRACEKTLQSNRFQFPPKWTYHERVQAEELAFAQILARRQEQFDAESSSIQEKLSAESRVLATKIKDFVDEWRQKRPLSGGVHHSEIQDTLARFESQLTTLEEELDRMQRAKQALLMPSEPDTRLDVVHQELDGFKEVAQALTSVWKRIEPLSEQRYVDCKWLETRRALEKIIEELKEFPNRIRQYESFEDCISTVNEHLKHNWILQDFSSGTLRPKHQKQMLKVLKCKEPWDRFTVGQIWKSNLKIVKEPIKAIMENAQGESALEEFINEISETWERTIFDMVDYRQKCWLIRNWEELMSQVADQVSSITSMKQSPFFKAFEAEALTWESTLNKAQSIFDVLIDVQRRWVYLEGVFMNSADVQHQLAYQYRKFKTFDREFVKLMRGMHQTPQVDVWVKDDKDLLSRLESDATLLNAIQKALGDYLETQRLAFPRFYFVGDEDLLEIIGNSKDPRQIIKHLSKMFAGITSFTIGDEALDQQGVVTGMVSREGEEVPFFEPVDTAEDPAIQAWLSKVEYQMRFTIASLLEEAVKADVSGSDSDSFFEWVDRFPAQVVLLATQIRWSRQVEDALKSLRLEKAGKLITSGGDDDGGSSLPAVLADVKQTLNLLAEHVLLDLPGDRRKKYEQLITELVHQRDVTRELIKNNVSDENNFDWLYQMRFYWNPNNPELLHKLEIKLSRASFYYGFEYLGVAEKLVQTPLTDRCYLTMSEALHARLGGNPFGPAGTGKTESVKALGAQLGRFVLVFNCDETFDFHAMGRIFVGLCQCGFMGCFDEFNRLEERILSAVSQQILTIQTGLAQRQKEIRLIGKPVKLNQQVGIFVTMNPGYAGRSELPDNLKQLFRGIAMMKPNRQLIAQVMLYSQGFSTAESLSGKIVLLFTTCKDQLSSQSHYDFGLRALKAVLRSAGRLKREAQKAAEESKGDDTEHSAAMAATLADASNLSQEEFEQQLLLRSLQGTVIPKLVTNDIVLFESLMRGVFPTAKTPKIAEGDLLTAIDEICAAKHLRTDDCWKEKLLQLYTIQDIHHGVILVGPSGTGKSSGWRVLLEAMERVDGIKSESYVINPKAIKKEELYGQLDPTTLEWTDGVFTHMLRKIIESVRGERSKRHWILFDGDVDPEWAENLNSVLDDNKILTLPNGERLQVTPNIRIMFEAKNLQYATPATVSRCGMVWFSEECMTNSMIFSHEIAMLRTEPARSGQVAGGIIRGWEQLQDAACTVLEQYFVDDGIVNQALDWGASQKHVMAFTRMRALTSLFSLLKGGMIAMLEYNDSHPDFPLTEDQISNYMSKHVVFSVLWSVAGSCTLAVRLVFGKVLHEICAGRIDLPPEANDLIDYEVEVNSQEWVRWGDRLHEVDIESHQVIHPNFVVDTVDTVRHEFILRSWLHDRKTVLLCGPPGSGKSMTLAAVLNANPQYELVTLNFASSTDVNLLFKTFDHYCRYTRTPNGYVLSPVAKGKNLVIFCDEVNLPEEDAYGTQSVITFMRQIIESGGFWRVEDRAFVTLDRIQFVGACNPPTDPGRVVLTERFMRHCSLVLVDFPARDSLRQIYGTFVRGLLKLVPTLRSFANPLTEAMIDVYMASQKRFLPDTHPHYIYSPRELSRWVRGMYGAVAQVEGVTQEELVRLWLHEGLRLFQDRLVEDNEREWTDRLFDETAKKHFPECEPEALQRPVFYSNWLSRAYVSVEQEALREHVIARLRVFREEELDVKLVIFDEVLNHILRIDRVLRQPLGHLLLVGASGAGKTVLSRFVAWMNGMSTFQIKVHKGYTAKDFDEDLRSVLIRSGCKGEKICFIFDESNVLDSAFLERMNALLASGEVPGLFEDADYQALIAECREAAKRDGVMIEDEEGLFQRFSRMVQTNLHIVFTMNPANPDFENRSATSPALFNRCVVDWFGEWSDQALTQVGTEFTAQMDVGIGIEEDQKNDADALDRQRSAVVSSLVYVHKSVQSMMHVQLRRTGRSSYVTPRHYLDLIKHFVSLFAENRDSLEEQQLHTNSGLRRLKETEEEVSVRQEALTTKRAELTAMDKQANETLERIMENERKATEKRAEGEKIKVEIDEQKVEIDKRASTVAKELAEVGPMLEEAAEAVTGISRRDLTEIANLLNPPALVKLTLEAVFALMGHNMKDWNAIRREVRKPGFTKGILEFKSEDIKDKVRANVQKNYLDDPRWDMAKIDRASKACGPLAKWCTSQANYAKILQSVEPLRKEVSQLSKRAGALKVEHEEVTSMIKELTASIASFKEEYKHLIAETERIRTEMESVKSKLDRSISLIANLGSERDRWEAQSSNFRRQLTTLVGDSLVAAAFITYTGWFDHSYRRILMEKWRDQLADVELVFQDNLSMNEYLSKPAQRLQWKENKLPEDQLCVENAIMLERFNRYPLIIDPSGQATTFIMNQFRTRKIMRTSFLDDNFLKALESALRFGNALLVDDVESIDPVLNPVLNREIQKVGGRVLIRVGDKDIDFSPKFLIFLCTRDPTCFFTPDLCSRVTFVNFSVSPSSLQSQCLSQILKAEAPDVDKQRNDLLKLQGEFRVRLRTLEETLLTALNEVQGNILDDDSIITKLETLKNEAAEVNKKMSETEVVMQTVASVSAMYHPFAAACSKIFFSMENLGVVYFLYQYSLPFFLDIVMNVLRTKITDGQVSSSKELRLRHLSRQLFCDTFERTSRGMLRKDHIGFALRLTQIYLEPSDNKIGRQEMEFLMKGKVDAKATLDSSVPADEFGFTSGALAMLTQLLVVDSVSGLADDLTENLAAWQAFKRSDTNQMPTAWMEGSGKRVSEVQQQVLTMLVQKVFRPDLFIGTARALVSHVFSEEFMGLASKDDLKNVTKEQANCRTPLLLVSTPGNDPSGRVDELAHEFKQNKTYESYAMGSPEGYDKADQAVAVAVKKGSWILLKNVHLSPSWLANLEKKLHRLEPHQNFRLFLTMEINPKVPATLLRKSYVVVFEPPAGIKASLQRTYLNLPPQRVDRAPAERSRLYVLLAWLHAVVIERLRYHPVGWSKHFEFSETDQLRAMDAMDEWIDKLGADRAHVDPAEIPWRAMQAMLEQYIYGGRIDNRFDNDRLAGFVRYLFSEHSFDADFSIAQAFSLDGAQTADKQKYVLPASTNYLATKRWINEIDEVESSAPTILGLPANAEQMLLARSAREVFGQLLTLHDMDDTSAADLVDDVVDVVDADLGGATTTPPWMVDLMDSLKRWRELLPARDELNALPRRKESVKNPLYRSLSREVLIGMRVLKIILDDAAAVQEVCDGTEKATNDLRKIFTSLRGEQVPPNWFSHYTVTKSSVSLWVADLAKRLKQLRSFAETNYVEEPTEKVWLGGLFQPEAFVAATRQAVSQRNNWSLEQLKLVVYIGRPESEQNMNTFVFEGLRLNGAAWNASAGTLELSDRSAVTLPPTHFEWVLRAADAKDGADDDDAAAAPKTTIPVYLNDTLEHLLFDVQLPVPRGIPTSVWSQRGTNITLWSS